MEYNFGMATLNLRGKGLSRVPDAVTELSEVENLILNHNNLTELPTSIRKAEQTCMAALGWKQSY